MDPGPIIGLLAASWAGAGLVAAKYLSRDAVTRRRLERSRPVPVRDFPAGRIAKVAGTVRFVGRPLVAPLTGRACAYYQVWVRSLDAQLVPGVPPTEHLGQDFVLVDAAGAGALVRIADAHVALTQDARASYSVGNVDPRARAYLDALAARSRHALLPNPPVEITEAVLAQDELVAVCGLGAFEADPVPDVANTADGRGYRGLPQRLVLRATEKYPLLVSDDPRTTR